MHPEQYVNRVYRSKVENQEGEKAVESLSQSLEVTYVEPDGTETYRIEGERSFMACALSPMSEKETDDVVRINSYISQLTGLSGDAREQLQNTSNWSTVDLFEILSDNQNIDILHFLPEGSRIFCFNHDTGITDGQVIDRGNYYDIYVVGKIGTLRSISIVTHEVGHVIDMQQRTDAKYGNIHGDWSPRKQLSELLLRERNASAFELNVLRQLVHDDQKRELIKQQIHCHDLGSYVKVVRQKLAKILRSKDPGFGDCQPVDPYDQDLEEKWQEFLEDQWFEFKKSDVFDTWFQENNLCSETDDRELFRIWEEQYLALAKQHS